MTLHAERIMIPRVSVIMGVFNLGEKPALGLDSMLAQEFDGYEIVVVDDGSTDDTATILGKYARRDDRVRVILAPCNLGLAGALNLAISEARADILMRMDIDDWSPVQRMARQYDFLLKHPEVEVVSCAFELVTRTGQVLRVTHPPVKHEEIIRKLSLGASPICHAGAMIRKGCYLKYGFYDPFFRRAQDLELWLRWRPYVTFGNLDEVLLRVTTDEALHWERARGDSYWGCCQRALLARYLNFPRSKTKWLDLYGLLRLLAYYFVWEPTRRTVQSLRSSSWLLSALL
jgi:glycosyltransferase involved in cell wall biosynthesis